MKAAVQSSGAGELVLQCSIGQIGGFWRQGGPPPSVGEIVEVEFDLNVKVASGDIVVSTHPRLSRQGGVNYIVGQMESTDEDAMGYLRLAPDCLLMVETDGTVAAGSWVQFRIASSSVGIFGGIVGPPR